MDLYLETFNISELVNDVAAVIHPLLEENANTLKVDCPESVGSMWADKTKMWQALVNLMSNAGKFTKQGTITSSWTVRPMLAWTGSESTSRTRGSACPRSRSTNYSSPSRRPTPRPPGGMAVPDWGWPLASGSAR